MQMPSSIEVSQTEDGLRIDITIERERIEDAEGFDISALEERLEGYDKTAGDIEVVWHFN